jgi:acetylornithine/N-succinyldiaminopimelate aminotransferase
MLTREDIAATFQPGTHGTTYGGNPLACAVAGEVLDIIGDPSVLAGVKQRSDELRSGLEAIGRRHGVFREVRGRGLLLGAVLSESWQGRAREFLRAGLEQGVMVLVAGADVVRLAPSLVIEHADVAEGLERLERAVEQVVAAEAR